jgi:hypothetical protein
MGTITTSAAIVNFKQQIERMSDLLLPRRCRQSLAGSAQTYNDQKHAAKNAQ